MRDLDIARCRPRSQARHLEPGLGLPGLLRFLRRVRKPHRRYPTQFADRVSAIRNGRDDLLDTDRGTAQPSWQHRSRRESGNSARLTHEQRWITLYGWLAAPIVMPDGRAQEWDRGPAGPMVSPVLASQFTDYAFDCWLEGEFPAP
jgi:hypothetical protein